MSVPVIEAIADAIYAMEGCVPRSRAYMNRNPGNLRCSSFTKEYDGKGYCVFPHFTMGYVALLIDLKDKVTGRTKTGLGPTSTLLDLFTVWAPAADGNDPYKYAEFVVGRLQSVYETDAITSATTFKALFAFAGQEFPNG